MVADYRLFPGAAFPEFMEDAARAYGWVDDHIARNGKRPIVVIGHSAGAYMAALLALDPSYLGRFALGAATPAGLVGMSGPYSFDPTTWPTTRDIFLRAAADPDNARPVAFASAAAPPTLLLYGLSDDIVGAENRIRLAKALTDHGASVERIDYPGIWTYRTGDGLRATASLARTGSRRYRPLRRRRIGAPIEGGLDV